MLFTIFIIVAILLGLALVGLGINILFRKNGKFPETHIGKNKAMKDRGIHCANTTDRLDRQNYSSLSCGKPYFSISLTVSLPSMKSSPIPSNAIPVRFV